MPAENHGYGTGAPQASGHIQALDGVRGLAVVMVFLDHASNHLHPSSNAALEWARRICSTGWFGVDIFFVLSGFLITTILLEARSTENFYKVFYARRFLRIAPLYYGVLFLALLLEPGLHLFRRHEGQIWYWLNLSNLPTAFNPYRLGFLLHFWSLAIEEQFYLVWPTIVRHLRIRGLAWVCGAVIAGVTLARNLPAVLVENARYPEFVYRLTPFRVDTLCGGALLAIVLLRRPEWLRHRWAARAAAIVGFSLFALSGGNYKSAAVIHYGYTSLLLGAVGLLTLCLFPGEPIARFFSHASLRSLGKYSYAFYLFHPFAVNWFGGNAGRIQHRLNVLAHLRLSYNEAAFLAEGAAFWIVLGAAMLSWRFFESPILSNKRHFKYSPRPEHILA